jgi:hypothetical protein
MLSNVIVIIHLFNLYVKDKLDSILQAPAHEGVKILKQLHLTTPYGQTLRKHREKNAAQEITRPTQYRRVFIVRRTTSVWTGYAVAAC